MRYKLFHFSVPCEAESEAELNSFLAGHRVVNVTHHLVPRSDGATLLFVVEYLDANGGGDSAKSSGSKARIDYREKLSEADFEIFRQLRDLRKQMAEAEGVPVYNVFTNAQLAEIAEKRIVSRSRLEKVDGVGQARIDKYGDRMLTRCLQLTGGPGSSDNSTPDREAQQPPGGG